MTEENPAGQRQRSEGLVSVVVCNFNYARYLDAALHSVAAQSIECELIVIDDGSTDRSREILAGWRTRATVVFQENGGQVAAYNAGFLLARGEFVIFLDSDDLLETSVAERAVALFAPDVSKVHWKLGLIDADGEPLGGTIPHRLGTGDVGSALRMHGLLYSSAPGSGNAYRSSVLAKLFPLPLDETDRHGADFFTIYGSALFGLVRELPAIGGRYRIHASADTPLKRLSFGNAELDASDPLSVLGRRMDRFRTWLRLRTDGRLELPERFLEFSIEKLFFARAIFSPETYRAGLRAGAKHFRPLLRALWLRGDMTPLGKLSLTLWSVIVILLPRRLGLPLALHVCNPATRE